MRASTSRGFAVLGLLSFVLPSAEAAVITIQEDSATAFIGSFQLTGSEHAYFQFAPLLQPSNFRHFPTDISLIEPANLYISRSTEIRPVPSGPFNTSKILTNDQGIPDDPSAAFSNGLPFGPLTITGLYSNSLPIDSMTQAFAGTVVWSYTDLQDTGGPNGTFSGTFAFRFVPDGGSSALMLGSGFFAMVALAQYHRRRTSDRHL